MIKFFRLLGSRRQILLIPRLTAMSTSTKMAPSKTRSEKVTVAARQTTGDDTTTTNNDQLAQTKWHHDLISVKRIFDEDNQLPSIEYPQWLWVLYTRRPHHEGSVLLVWEDDFPHKKIEDIAFCQHGL